MTIHLPSDKVGKMITRCEKLLTTEQVTIGLLTSTYQVVLPGHCTTIELTGERVLPNSNYSNLRVSRGIDTVGKKSITEIQCNPMQQKRGIGGPTARG